MQRKAWPIYRAFSMTNPIHDKTPRIVLRGRSIFITEKPDGWHIVLFVDDEATLLRVLPYANAMIASCHAVAFSEHYNAKWYGLD
jgi:hypothetical protein